MGNCCSLATDSEGDLIDEEQTEICSPYHPVSTAEHHTQPELNNDIKLPSQSPLYVPKTENFTTSATSCSNRVDRLITEEYKFTFTDNITLNSFFIDVSLLRPSVYVTSKFSQQQNNKPVFTINGDMFLENEDIGNDYVEYEVVHSSECKDKVIIWNNREITVDFNAWNMILYVNNSNQYYCMLCKEFGDGTSLTEHCTNENHVLALEESDVIETYDDNIIRRVDFKYCHCLICNNLQIINELQLHISLFHAKEGNIHYQNKNGGKRKRLKNKQKSLLNEYVNEKQNTEPCKNHKPIVSKPRNSRIVKCPTETNARQASCLTATTEEQRTLVSDLTATTDIKQRTLVSDLTAATDVKGRPAASSLTAATDENINADDKYTEECILIKLNDYVIKSTSGEFHSVRRVCNGWVCLVCSMFDVSNLKEHLESGKHFENFICCKFILGLGANLIRKIRDTYVCSFCFRIIKKHNLKQHLNGVEHSSRSLDRNADDKIYEKHRFYVVPTVTDDVANDIEVDRYDAIRNSTYDTIDYRQDTIIIVDGAILKLKWNAWHSIIKLKYNYRCILCWIALKDVELSSHLKSVIHCDRLEGNFVRKFLPAMIRKVNKKLVNCVTCNVFISNGDTNIIAHIGEKQHSSKENNLRLNKLLDLDLNLVLTLR